MRVSTGEPEGPDGAGAPPGGPHLSVGRGPAGLAAAVAVVGAQRRPLHRVRGAGGGAAAALGQTQAAAVVLLALHMATQHRGYAGTTGTRPRWVVAGTAWQ